MKHEIHTDIKHGPLEVIGVTALADACTQKWWNQSPCRVNDCAVRLGVFEDEFHWHSHDKEDEVFYVLEGQFPIDLEGRMAELSPGQAMLVPRGILHRTRAPHRTVVLMIEAATIVPTGD